MPLIAPYLLSLCDAAQGSNFSFRLATRLGTQSSPFNIDATKLIHSVVTFSPAPESVAIEFLQEFQKLPGIDHLGNPLLISSTSPLADAVPVEAVLSRLSELDFHQWAQEVLKVVRNRTEQQLSVELKAVRNLATEYLTHLLIAGLFIL